jgi:hypothetical protein
MIHGYTSLNHPLAQMQAVQEFCAQVDSYITDVWDEERSGDPPAALKRISDHLVIDVLAKSGLRFEMGQSKSETEDMDIYFSFKYFGTPIDRVLYRLALKFVISLRNELDLVPELDLDTMWRIVVRYACSWEGLIFVVDDDDVVPRAVALFADSEFFEFEDEIDDDDDGSEEDDDSEKEDDTKKVKTVAKKNKGEPSVSN